jgi:benzoyl-CoA-dihydrodiol lyase
MLQTEDEAPTLSLSEVNFGAYPMVTQLTRLERRFSEDAAALEKVHAAMGWALDASAAQDLGLVTAAPDELDWDDEIRIALEERASLSPDALTGLEANLRFGGHESMASRIFGRLSAWQNWIFTRPNAVGELGALKVYGTGTKAKFNWERV